MEFICKQTCILLILYSIIYYPSYYIILSVPVGTGKCQNIL